jgi:hypothetical protein
MKGRSLTRQLVIGVIALASFEPVLHAGQPPAAQSGEDTGTGVEHSAHSIGLSFLGLFADEPTLIAADDGVRVRGTVWAASAGVEVTYGYQVFRPTASIPMEVALEFPVLIVPTVHRPEGAEMFDPVTGQSLGPAEDYRATYFTPRLKFRYRTHWPVQFVIGLGGGVARFSDTWQGRTRHVTDGTIHYLIGLSLPLREGWRARATYGGYSEEGSIGRRLHAISGGVAHSF